MLIGLSNIGNNLTNFGNSPLLYTHARAYSIGSSQRNSKYYLPQVFKSQTSTSQQYSSNQSASFEQKQLAVISTLMEWLQNHFLQGVLLAGAVFIPLMVPLNGKPIVRLPLFGAARDLGLKV
ncbi:MAG: hypothetical protein SFT81_07700 [Candidatus Caenarcaniphilales bacterium]|nr:hypothetical protein [Candidatus Caenarcaniphilales bacterium]